MEHSSAASPHPTASHLLPPRLHWSDGRPRRVGIEIEFGGLNLADATRSVRSVVGGRVESSQPERVELVDTEHGNFRLELDSKALRDMADEAQREADLLSQAVTNLVVDVARLVVPIEVITPPVPMDKLGVIDEIVQVLGRDGARGTRSGLQRAFGVHFNPEPPDLDVDTVLGYLRAFLLLEDWLRGVERIDISRRFTPFIDPFPAGYRRLVTDPGYRPTMERMIDDYLAANPTRNRDLDMLPLFRHIAAARVDAVVQEPGGSRPTFHYRLPNSFIGEPGWGLTAPWQRWLAVERMAAQPDLLRELGRAYAEHLDDLVSLRGRWLQRIDAELAVLTPGISYG